MLLWCFRRGGIRDFSVKRQINGWLGDWGWGGLRGMADSENVYLLRELWVTSMSRKL